MSVSRISIKGTPLMGAPKKFTNHPSSTLTFATTSLGSTSAKTTSQQSHHPSQQKNTLPSISEWGPETWKVLDRAVQMYEFLENENPPAHVLDDHAYKLKMYFMNMPSSLPCWKCIRHSTELIEKKEPDTSSAKALREWFEWFKNETNKHVQEQKQLEKKEFEKKQEPQISKNEHVDPEMLRLYKLIENKNTILRNAALHGWKPKSCSSC